jgi:hypothetical protein
MLALIAWTRRNGVQRDQSDPLVCIQRAEPAHRIAGTLH